MLRGEMASKVATADGLGVTLLSHHVTLEATVEEVSGIVCLFKRSLNS